ncbi:MAG: ABC transporter permease [Candidatus Micrarchaeia archaeon]
MAQHDFVGGIRKYAALVKLEFKREVSYRLDLVLSIVTKIAGPLVMVFVWSVVFLSSHVSSIGSYSLDSMIAYFFSISLVELVLYTDLPYIMQYDFKRGRIASKLAMPIGYIGLTVVSALFGALIWAVLVGLPLFVIIVLAFHITLTLQHLLLFAASMLIGLLIALSLDFILGCMSVFTNDINGITSFYEIGSGLLGGAIIPLSLFPQYLGKIMYLLPFQFMFYVPISEFTGVGAVSTQSFWIGIVWFAAFTMIGYISWRFAFKRATSVGG